jgi:uncharacterized protein GlcG (DUF336 family)
MDGAPPLSIQVAETKAASVALVPATDPNYG